MNFFAIKMIMGDRLKYLGLLLGLTFAATLITQQMGIFLGYTLRMFSFITDTPAAQLWVMDPQTKFTEDSKPISDTAALRVRGVDGVDWAVPMYRGPLNVKIPGGQNERCVLIGVDDGTLVGGPPKMVEGRIEDLRRSDAVIVEEKAAKTTLQVREADGSMRALRVGDTLSINDRSARVVGLCALADAFFWEPVLYTTYSRALNYAPPERRQTSFVLAGVKAGKSVDNVAKLVEAATGLSAYTNDGFTRLTTLFVLKKTGILINFGITVALGFLIGILVSGQTFYNFVVDNARHFGSLKALGLSNRRLLGMILLQVLVVGAIGYGLGVGAASVSGTVLRQIGLSFILPKELLVGSAVAMLGICLVAACLGAVRVMRLEPGIVFRGG